MPWFCGFWPFSEDYSNGNIYEDWLTIDGMVFNEGLGVWNIFLLYSQYRRIARRDLGDQSTHTKKLFN